jgi:hypothetical protein
MRSRRSSSAGSKQREMLAVPWHTDARKDRAKTPHHTSSPHAHGRHIQDHSRRGEKTLRLGANPSSPMHASAARMSARPAPAAPPTTRLQIRLETQEHDAPPARAARDETTHDVTSATRRAIRCHTALLRLSLSPPAAPAGAAGASDDAVGNASRARWTARSTAAERSGRSIGERFVPSSYVRLYAKQSIIRRQVAKPIDHGGTRRFKFARRSARDRRSSLSGSSS